MPGRKLYFACSLNWAGLWRQLGRKPGDFQNSSDNAWGSLFPNRTFELSAGIHTRRVSGPWAASGSNRSPGGQQACHPRSPRARTRSAGRASGAYGRLRQEREALQ